MVTEAVKTLLEKRWVPPAAAALAGALILLPLLGRSGLWDPYESMWAEVAREAADEGSWLPLRFDGTPVHGLPPLLFWCEAVWMLLAGSSEWAVRLPLALLAVGWIAYAAVQGARVMGRGAGTLGALALATSAVVVVGGRHTGAELFSAMVTAAAVLAVLVVITSESPVRRRDVTVAHLLGAATVLAAGVLPLVLLAAALASGRLMATIPAGRIRRLLPRGWQWAPWAAAAAWLVAGTAAAPAQFWQRAVSIRPFVHSTLAAFARPADAPFSWQVQQAGHMCHPWLVALPAAILWLAIPGGEETGADVRRRHATLHVLLALPLLVVVTASLWPPYLPLDVVTASPLLTLVAAWGLTRAARCERDERWRTLLPLGGVLVMLGAGSQGVDFFWYPRRVLEVGGYMFDRVIPELGTSAKVLHTAVAIAVGVSAAPLTFFRRWSRVVPVAMLGGALAVCVYDVIHVFPGMERYISVGPLARAYEEARTDRDRLVAVELDPQARGGHVYYFERRMEHVGGLEALPEVMEDTAGEDRLILLTSHVRALYNEVHRLSCGRRIDPLNEERRWYAISAFEGPPPLPAYRIVIPGGRAAARIDHPADVDLSHGGRVMLSFLGHDARVRPRGGTVARGRIAAPRGSWVDLSLYFRTVAQPSRRWRVLLDAVATVPAEAHRTIKGHHEPACGRHPTYLWRPGDVIRDRTFLYVPFSQPRGSYRLRTGIYDGSDKMTRRVRGAAAGGRATIDLGILEVI